MEMVSERKCDVFPLVEFARNIFDLVHDPSAQDQEEEVERHNVDKQLASL